MDLLRVKYFQEDTRYYPHPSRITSQISCKKIFLGVQRLFLVAYFPTSHAAKTPLMKKRAISVLFTRDVKSRFYLILLGTARAFAVTSAVSFT